MSSKLCWKCSKESFASAHSAVAAHARRVSRGVLRQEFCRIWFCVCALGSVAPDDVKAAGP
eukprot:2636920-Rhodomonas_salina.2